MLSRQQQLHIVIAETGYTEPVLGLHDYRIPLLCETRSYELLKVKPQANLPLTTNLFRLDEMQALVQATSDGAHDIPYDDLDGVTATLNVPYRRLTKRTRQFYRKNDLSDTLPLGKLEAMALPDRSFKLALTPGLLNQFSSKVSAAEAATLLIDEGKYVDLDGDGNLWIPLGRSYFSPDPVNPDQAFAHNHFYMQQCADDAFGNLSSVGYDAYQLFAIETVDPVGNSVTATLDYRVLQPALVTDANQNRTAIAFDIFGKVVASAVMGKAIEPDGIAKGDTLQGVIPDLSTTQIDAFFSDPTTHAAALLGQATSRVVYSNDRFAQSGLPNCAATLLRETHIQDLLPGQQSKIQITLSFSDGFGREIQKKVQAEAGPVQDNGPTITPRWVGSGWVVFNNKGKPVKQYEPFFSATHDFELSVQRGVGSILFYDPLGRIVATLHPNHSYGKTVFDPWQQTSWDVNDTVLLDPATDPDVSPWIARLPTDAYQPTWRALRTDPAYAAQAAQTWPDPLLRQAEAEAAAKAAAHAGTPTMLHLDGLGRTFLTVVDNGVNGKHASRADLDIDSRQRSVTDALGRTIMSYVHDMIGARLYQNSIDSGERWTFNDAGGKPLRLWDARGQTFRNEYDALRRPTKTYVQGSDPQQPASEILSGHIVYGEHQLNDTALNLRGRIFLQYDESGISVFQQYDFKGNLTAANRTLLHDYKTPPDWSQAPQLQTETYTGNTRYDALNRVIQSVVPHSDAAGTNIDVVQYAYNEANLLEAVDVWLQRPAPPHALLDPATADLHAVAGIDYDVRGQRRSIDYGNGTQTLYTYDPQTFHLVRLQTVRSSDGVALQDLRYVYDPVGNITHMQDDADIQNVVYFKNQRVDPSADFMYDALYQLIQASGREHLGQMTATGPSDPTRTGLLHPGDGNVMGRYLQNYLYDAVGNMLEIRHRSTSPAQPGWKRCYQYALDSNRLLSTGGPSDPNNPDSDCPVHYAAQPVFSEHYTHDGHGNMTSMPHLSLMEWNSKDQLRHADLGGGGQVYCVYDASSKRIRKVLERLNGSKQEERIYLNGFEIYRRYDGAGTDITLERETLHVMDDKQRVALIDIRTKGVENAPPQSIRFQLSNHIRSAVLELDQQGEVISYEEYHPYGSSAYEAVRSGVEVSLKRYRYAGMEHDDETGLNLHGARYYAPWLGRWVSADPSGIKDGVNLFAYGYANPVHFKDTNGKENIPVSEADKKIAASNPNQLGTYLRGLSPEDREKFLQNANGAFKTRTLAALTEQKLEHHATVEPPVRQGKTVVEPPVDMTNNKEVFNKIDYPLFESQVEQYSSDKKYTAEERTHDQTDDSPEHIRNVFTVINTALDISIERTKTRKDMNVRHQVVYSLALIIKFRDKHNSHDITFRDADHYFAGRLQEWQNHLPWNTDDNRNFSPLGWEEKDLPNPFIGALSDLPTNYYDNQKRQGVDVSVNQDGSASAPGGRMWPHLGEVYYYNNDMNKQLDKVPADKVSDKDIEYYTNPPQDTPSMTPSDESMIRILRMAVPQL